MKYQVHFFLACCISSACLAQPSNKDTSKRAAGEWIEMVNDYIQLKLTHTNDIEKFAVVVAPGSNTSQYISPNANSVTRLGFSYKFLSFGYSFIPKFLPGNADDDIRGATKGKGFNINFNFSKWQQELSYSRTTGFFLENTKDYDPNWQDGDPFAQLPNLRITNVEGLTAYKFNQKYSLNAVATQSERQLRSAGTFMPSLLYRYYIVDDRRQITSTNTTFKSNNFEMLAGAGYYHTFVFKKSYYVSLGATPAAGFIHTNFFARTASQITETPATNFIFRWDVRSGIGYNGERFFAGAYLRAFGASNKQYSGSTAINTDARTAIQLFLGYRINAPKWLKQKVTQVQSIVPL